MSQGKNKNAHIVLIHSRPQDVEPFFKDHLPDCDVTALSLVDIEPVDFTLPVADLYLITSANAVQFLPNNSNGTMIAVGEQTKESLCEAGIQCEDVAYGTNAELHADMARYKGKKIVHLCGIDRSPDGQTLSNDFDVKVVPVYKAVLKTQIPDIVLNALKNSKKIIFVFFSARGAQAFVSLFTSYKDCAKLTHYKEFKEAVAISARVSDSLDHELMSNIDVAGSPDRHSILKLIQHKLEQDV